MLYGRKSVNKKSEPLIDSEFIKKYMECVVDIEEKQFSKISFSPPYMSK